MILKCKMCGGDLEIKPGASVAVCPFCDSRQTLPKTHNTKRINLYERANQLRRQNEFDRAMEAYEQILQDDGSDAEAYWSLVLCRYGIEYVEDPATHRRVPTMNRMQSASILADADYKSALEHADSNQRKLYENEAKQISDIQKQFLEISQKEQPFDVFICYKETDVNGRRTKDSALAQEIYYGLSDEGYRVFFSRITLEDKLGSQYEPYIFAALHSAKVMLVVGTQPVHFNATWVKNEWARFLSLMKTDRSRLIIPCYRDMDPYELPEELSIYQSQDMSKIGFLQDLIRGLKKVINKKEDKPARVANDDTPQKQQNTLNASDMFDERLKEEQRNYETEKKRIEDEIRSQRVAYESKSWLEQRRIKAEYESTIGTLQRELLAKKTGFEVMQSRILHEKNKFVDTFFAREKQYQEALRLEENKEYYKACEEFKKLGGWYDSPERARECEKAYKAELYQEGLKLQRQREYSKAAEVFLSLGDYSDSEERKEQCRKEQSRYKQEALDQQRNEQIRRRYEDAIALQDDERWEEAHQIFVSLGNYKDSIKRSEKCYKQMIQEGSESRYEPEKPKSQPSGRQRKSEEKKAKAQQKQEKYEEAVILQRNKKWEEAQRIFADLGRYLDSKDRKKQCARLIEKESEDIDDVDEYTVEKVSKRQPRRKKRGGCFGRIIKFFIFMGIISVVLPLVLTNRGGVLDKLKAAVTSVSGNKTQQTVDDILQLVEDDSKIKGSYVDGGNAGNIIWEFQDSGLLIISGNGSVGNASAWSRHKYNIQHVRVGEGVTAIPDEAFSYASKLKTVTLPSTLKTIGKRAFYYCSALEEITIPGSVKTIGAEAFKYSGVAKCILGEGVTAIPDEAFYYCSSLKEINIPGSVKTIGAEAFKYTGLTKCIIGEGTTTIHDEAFYYADDLKTVTLPNTLKSIGKKAFYNCCIGEIYIPQSVTKIGESAFQFNNLRKVYYNGTHADWLSLLTNKTGLEDAVVVFN